jgi:hypothetical protein
MASMDQYDIYYLDTLNGGSGCLRLYITDVPFWLAKNKGYLIREMQPLGKITHMEEWKKANQFGWEQVKQR